MSALETMRDEHLSIARESEIYTPHLNQKWFHSLIVPMYEDDSLSRLFIQLRDISSFKKQEVESLEQARRDPLTGLYNRTGFSERVCKILHASDKTTSHSLLFIDMNYFKLVNDNLGHSSGDELLASVARDLQAACGPDSIVSRIGGDEFAVFLPGASRAATERVGEELSKKLVYAFQTNQIYFTVTASTGMAQWDASAPCSLEDLLQKADADMYQNKRAFKQTI